MHTSSLPAESLAARAARNFFIHSGHVPLVILILEVLLARPGYFLRPDPYALLFSGIAQAWLTEWMRGRGRPHPFLSNLIGPLVYSLIEAKIEGIRFFGQLHHLAYWGFALGFAALHFAREGRKGIPYPLVLAENILRSAIPFAMYIVFEMRIKSTAFSFSSFFADGAHAFLGLVLLLLGVLLGVAEIGLQRSLVRINELTARLRQYSEWSLGRGILDRAIADERVLHLQRVERTILFLDIRGFTAWSERQPPEAVAAMLTAYYRIAETVLADENAIKIKYTADEVMAVFPDADKAIRAGRQVFAAIAPHLAASGLSAGCGIHCGPVVEGILGGEGTRAYDVLGDTVNTAKRLCDAAGAGELLVSNEACRAADMHSGKVREVAAKGKREPVRAAVIDVVDGTSPMRMTQPLVQL